MRPRRLPVAAALLAALLPAGCGEDEVVRPEPLHGPDAVEYPLAQWAAGVEGETTLRVRVTDTGAVDSIEVTGSSGHLDLDSAAVAGVRTLRFEPGRMSGHRTRMWVTLPVLFVLGASPADSRGAVSPPVQ